MSEYRLELKQIVDYPRCRIYRQFIQNLISDRASALETAPVFLLHRPMQLRKFPHVIQAHRRYQLYHIPWRMAVPGQ